jgi:hypothetical protein
MKTRYKILIAVICIFSTSVVLFEILDNFFRSMIHDINKDNAIKNYQTLETTCNDVNEKPNGKCFSDAFDECKFATIKHMGSTFEGDPVFYYATIVPGDSCQIHLKKDISHDKWKGITTNGIMQRTCTGIHLEEHKMQFQCYDEEFTIYLR